MPDLTADVVRPLRTVLPEGEWQQRQAFHETRVDAWVTPHLQRRERGEKHPVQDFLFSYYSFRPAQLRRWHPGLGVGLSITSPNAARAWLGQRGYARVPTDCPNAAARGEVVALDPAGLSPALVATATELRALLAATAARAASFGCLGLHEWAMVYRRGEQRRHEAWPLRLGAAGTDAVVEGATLRCTHFDAFRFFTPEAEPRNAWRPRSDTRSELEQPGCLHATMDLYKAAYRLSPAVGSELVADCFELAREVRELDMRASPYDLRELGYEPVAIETAEGRAEYVRRQREFAERGQVLRQRLLTEVELLLAAAA
ncbi:MAG: hypothetical protein ACTHK1_11585 [Actinomycetales bacterium]